MARAGTLIVEDGVSAADIEGSGVATATAHDVPSFPEKAELVLSKLPPDPDEEADDALLDEEDG